MIKFIIMGKRKKGMTQEEFAKYWKEVHGPKVRNNVPGLIKYVQNHRINLDDDESTYDSIAELYFEDMNSYNIMSEWRISEKGRIIRDDEPNFMDGSKTVIYLCEEVVMK
jgi:uncharacterized protein (TIGR02118 family)